MHELIRLEDVWYVKVIFAVLTTLFSPFEISLAVLCSMIVIDTIAGSIYAFKIKKFNSRGFRKGLSKILIYFLCIMVVRLLEIGITPIFSTTHITEFITGYLTLTECFSILENLTLLGAPLPPGIAKIIINNIKSDAFKNVVYQGADRKNYKEEMLDMINYSIPNIKGEKMKSVLEVKLNEWIKFIDILDREMFKADNYSKDLLLCKILVLIEATANKTCEGWDIEVMPDNYHEGLMKMHKPRVDEYMMQIKTICDSDETIDKKKNEIIEKTIILLYKTMTDIQKLESDNYNW